MQINLFEKKKKTILFAFSRYEKCVSSLINFRFSIDFHSIGTQALETQSWPNKIWMWNWKKYSAGNVGVSLYTINKNWWHDMTFVWFLFSVYCFVWCYFVLNNIPWHLRPWWASPWSNEPQWSQKLGVINVYPCHLCGFSTACVRRNNAYKFWVFDFFVCYIFHFFFSFGKYKHNSNMIGK